MSDSANTVEKPTPHPESLWQLIALAMAERTPLVAATIVGERGSVPRRTGAKMLIYRDGRTRGTIGGGIFEATVVGNALAALAQRRSVTRHYSLNPKSGRNSSNIEQLQSGAIAVGAVCGGQVEVFLEVIMPTDRLLIVGGGHCGRALARAASLLDFSIVVADDRPEYAAVDDYDFENVQQVLHLPPDFAGLPVPDEQTFVVLVSKGYPGDEAALRLVLPSPAPYIGMIGSVRKREVVYDKLRADGIDDATLARVHAPIGLEIDAETPEEIAISILAEIIKVRAEQRKSRAGS